MLGYIDFPIYVLLKVIDRKLKRNSAAYKINRIEIYPS